MCDGSEFQHGGENVCNLSRPTVRLYELNADAIVSGKPAVGECKVQ